MRRSQVNEHYAVLENRHVKLAETEDGAASSNRTVVERAALEEKGNRIGDRLTLEKLRKKRNFKDNAE